MLRILLTLFLLTCSNILSSPLSSTSPEFEHMFQLEEKIEFVEQTRSRRSITALLAAEVIFLEGILAAQNSKKAENKVKKRKVLRPVKNYIHAGDGGKHASIDITQAYPPPVITKPTTIKPISQLDPFIMLDAPDLSRKPESNKEAFHVYKDELFHEQIQNPTKSDKREAKQIQNYLNKYGEFELYHPIVFAHAPTTDKFVISPTSTPTKSIQISSDRKPRKRTPKYGAFDLYEPSFVIKHKEDEAKKQYFSKKQTSSSHESNFDYINPSLILETKSYPFTFFTPEQAKKVHQSEHLSEQHPIKKGKKVKKNRNI